jgi:hypothetical protein
VETLAFQAAPALDSSRSKNTIQVDELASAGVLSLNCVGQEKLPTDLVASYPTPADLLAR